MKKEKNEQKGGTQSGHLVTHTPPDPTSSPSLLERMGDWDHCTLTFQVYDHIGEAEFGTEDVLNWLEDDESVISGGLDGLRRDSPGRVLTAEWVKAWLDHYAGFRWGNQVLVRANYGPPRWKVLNQRPKIPSDWFDRTLDVFTRGFQSAFGTGVLSAEEIFDLVMDDLAGEFGDYLFKLQRPTDCVINTGILEGWLEQCKGVPCEGLILLGSLQPGVGWGVVPFLESVDLRAAGTGVGVPQ